MKTLNKKLKLSKNTVRRLSEQQLSSVDAGAVNNRSRENPIVCAWTKQIKVGDAWLTPDEFLSQRLGMRLTHGISPAGKRQFEEEDQEDESRSRN